MNAVKSCTKKKLGMDSPYFNTFLELKLSKKTRTIYISIKRHVKTSKGLLETLSDSRVVFTIEAISEQRVAQLLELDQVHEV